MAKPRQRPAPIARAERQSSPVRSKLRQRPRAQIKGRSPEMIGFAGSQPTRAETYCQRALSDARAAEERQAKPLANATANAARTRSQQRQASLSLEKPPLEAQPVMPRKPQPREAAPRSEASNAQASASRSRP